MNQHTAPSRWTALAACTVAVAATLTPAQAESHQQRALTQIERYCESSWRNAGIQPQEWQDCTQQVVVELIETIPSHWSHALSARQTAEHQELKRAVWRTIKRYQRRPHVQSYEEPAGQGKHRQDALTWEDVQHVAEDCLTPRQQQVLQLTRDGWSVAEIARRMAIPPDRVSDAKYRAIQTLREKVET